MIEISHQKARRMIRQNLDVHLPEEQWNTLQAHLETCDECRAYRDRLGVIERDVRRALKTSWNVVPGPDASVPQQVVTTRRKRAAIQRKAVFAGAAAAVLMVFFLLGSRRLHTMPSAAPISATEIPKPTATPEPTLAAGEFRGVIAFDSTTRDGGTGIFLLNPASGSSAGGNEPVPDVLLDPSAFNTAGAKGGSQDSDPAWSPDGEWIAFLSARGTGKKEVFVSNVAASRVVQLTDEPDITWEGPLSWSPDGQWVALTGIRTKQGDLRWVYRIPVDGSGPIAVKGARNGYNPEYAPSGNRLAYAFSDGTQAGVTIQPLDGSEKASANWIDNKQSLPPAAGSGIDWSSDGTSLAYIAGVSPTADNSTGTASQGERILTARDLNYSTGMFYDFLRNIEAASSPWPGAYRGVAWSPDGSLVYLENVDDSRAHDAPGQTTTGCWTLQERSFSFRRGVGTPVAPSTPGEPTPAGPGAFSTPGENFRRGRFAGSPLTVSGLCVESGVDRSSWTPDGQWMVVLGRTPEEMASGAARGIYAVRLPRLVDRATGQTTESRIVRLATMDGAARMPRVRPAPGRSARPLNINPQPVQKRTVLSGSDLRLASGQIYFSHSQGNGSVIISMSPDGTGGKTLFGSDGTNRCPSPSPDGSWIAFTSDWNAQDAQSPATPDAPPQASGPVPQTGAAQSIDSTSGKGNEIFLMDTNGSNISQISNQGVAPDVSPGPNTHLVPDLYGCPVWSRDGKFLAAVVETPARWYLSVFAIEGGKQSRDIPTRFAPIGQPAPGLLPRWAVDDRRILIAQTGAGDTTPTFLSVDIPDSPTGSLITRPLFTVTGWDQLAGLDISPDGLQAAVIALQNHADGNVAELRIFDTRLGYQFNPAVLGVDYSSGPAQANMLDWASSGDINLVLHNASSDRNKVTVLRFDNRGHRQGDAIQVQDALYDAAWSPDGHWVIYATESGLWVANVDAVQSGSAAPVWISPEPVSDLVWK